MINEDSAFGPGMMFGIPGPGPKSDRKKIKSDPKKEKGKKIKPKKTMKNLKTFNEFVNESKQEINEGRGSSGKWSDKEEQACYDLMNPHVQSSIKSLGYGYKGGASIYNAEWSSDEGYRMQELPKMTWAIVPYADFDYWGKRDVKKMTDRFIKDLNDAQKEYEVTGEYYSKSRGPEIHVTFKKK